MRRYIHLKQQTGTLNYTEYLPYINSPGYIPTCITNLGTKLVPSCEQGIYIYILFMHGCLFEKSQKMFPTIVPTHGRRHGLF